MRIKIAKIVASIPGAKSSLHPTPTPKLKTCDFRKIRFQDSLSLNLNSPSIKSSKIPSSRLLSISARRHIILTEPRLNSLQSQKSYLKRATRIQLPPSRSHTSSLYDTITPISPSPAFIPTSPTPEWIGNGQEGSSSRPVGNGSRPSPSINGKTKTLAEILKGAQPIPANGPVILDASKLQRQGSPSQEDDIPCLHIPDTDNDKLAGHMGLALVGKFSHSIPAPHMIRKALNNIPLKGTLNWNFINAKHILITRL